MLNEQQILNLCKNGQFDTAIQFLAQLPNGANVNIQDENGLSPMHFAAANGNIEMVNSLLKKGADINIKDNQDRSPMHLAASNGKTDMVWLLADNKAKIDQVDKSGATPLHSSAKNGHKDIVEFLASNGANVNIQDNQKTSPMHFAASSGNINMINSLLQKGADINIQDGNGQSPMHFAASNGKTDMVKFFLDKGVDINIQDGNGLSPMHWAAWHGNKDMVNSLLAKGADVNIKDNRERSPMHAAAENGKTDMVQFFLDKGVDINIQDGNGLSPMHWAAWHGNKDMVNSLLQKGANINIKDRNGQSPMHWAASNGKTDMVKFFLDKGVDINIKDGNGLSPMHLAASNGKTDMVKFFLDKGVDINIKDGNGLSPMHLAACSGNTKMVEFLASNGANVNIQDKEGYTPLHLACKYEKWNVAEELLSNNIYHNKNNKNKLDVTTENHHGDTALMESAMKLGGAKTLELLLQRAPSQNLQKPLTKAIWVNNQQAVEKLSKHALVKNERHPLNNYSIISLAGEDHNKLKDVNGQETTSFKAVIDSVDTLKHLGVKMDTLNFQDKEVKNIKDLKNLITDKIKNSSEKKIIMLDLYHGNIEPNIKKHVIKVSKDFSIGTADYISICQDIAKEHGKEISHVNLSCVGGHALNKDLYAKDRKNGINVFSASPPNELVPTEYGVGLLSALICDTKFRASSHEELLFKMFAQEYSEKTAHVFSADKQNIRYQPLPAPAPLPASSLSSVLVVNGKTIDSWENLKNRLGKEVTEPEKEQTHKLLEGMWPKEKIEKAFTSIKGLKSEELEKLDKSDPKNYYDLKLLQIVAAGLEFNRNQNQNQNRIKEIAKKIIDKKIKGKSYDRQKIEQLKERITNVLYKNNPNDRQENIEKNINKILDKALIVKKGGLFSKSSISVELEDKKIFPPELIDKNKDPQNSYLGVNFPHGRFRESQIDESYLDKKDKNSNQRQTKEGVLSGNSSTLSNSQSRSENTSISNKSNVSSRDIADTVKKNLESPAESLTHIPPPKPKPKSQQI
jgi:ankyrin repeat protein